MLIIRIRATRCRGDHFKRVKEDLSIFKGDLRALLRFLFWPVRWLGNVWATRRMEEDFSPKGSKDGSFFIRSSVK